MAKKEVATPARPGVERIPLGTQDQWMPIDNIRSVVFFIVREILDEDLLRDSLDKLIRHHVPILGARIEPTGPKGRLEYHLPRPFPDDYELFRWSSKSNPSSFDDAQLLPSVENPKGVVTWGRSVPDLEKQWSPESWPVERKHEEPDTPIVLVHVTKYMDATVLTTNTPHAVCDQLGYASFMRAWLQVVRGETPPPFLQLSTDALDGAKDLPREELYKKGTWRVTTRQQRYRALATHVPELVTQPEEDRRLMFLSASLVKKLRDRGNEALKKKHGSEAPVLTSGDIIVGIIMKLGQLHRKSPKRMALTGVVNGRGRHLALPDDQPYLHNALAYYCAVFTLSRNTPLVEIARQNRVSVDAAINPESINRSYAVNKAMLEGGYGSLPTETGAVSLSMTNWCGAWRDISFSPAVIGNSGRDSKGETNGHIQGHQNGHANGFRSASNNESSLDESEPDAPVASAMPAQPTSSHGIPIVLGHSLERHIKICRFNAQVMCKEQGGYWVDFASSTKNMALMEELLGRDPYLETI